MYTPKKTIFPMMTEEDAKKRLKELEQTQSQRMFRVNSVTVAKNAIPVVSAHRIRLNSVVSTMGNYEKLNKDLSDILQDYIKEIRTEESAVEHLEVKKDKYHLLTALMDLINKACTNRSHPKDIAMLIKKACQIHDDIEANKSLFGLSFSLGNLMKKVAAAETSEAKKVNIALDPTLVETMKNRLVSAMEYSETFNNKNRAGQVLSQALEKVQSFEKGNYQPTRASNKK